MLLSLASRLLWQGSGVQKTSRLRTLLDARPGRALVVAVAVAALCGCGTVPPDDPVASTSAGDQSAPSDQGGSADPSVTDMGDQCEYVKTGIAARQVNLPPTSGVAKTGKVAVTVTTSSGPIVITMDRAKAPCTVNSFVSLVAQKFYDNTECDRLTTGGTYLLECGDPTGTGTGGPGYHIPDEYTGTEVFTAGTVALSNEGTPQSGGSRFFFVYADTDLPAVYTVFGTVDAAGLAVLKDIASGGQDESTSPTDGKPNRPVLVTTIAKTG